MEIKDLVKQSHKIAKEKGFWDKKRNVGELLMLICSELGEALEAHRSCRFAEVKLLGLDMILKNFHLETMKDYYKAWLKDSFETEIADAFIRLADLCGGLKIDIEKFIKLKIEYNKSREKLHGKRY